MMADQQKRQVHQAMRMNLVRRIKIVTMPLGNCIKLNLPPFLNTARKTQCEILHKCIFF